MPQKKKPLRLTQDNYLKYYYDIPYDGTTSQGKPLKKLKNITCPYRGIKIIPADALRGFEHNLAKVKTMVLLFSPTSVRDFDKIIKENINIIIDSMFDTII